MKPCTVQSECRSLIGIRQSWQSVVGWPLDRLDGENGIIECIENLRTWMLYDDQTIETAHRKTIDHLIEDLDDLYRTALHTFDEFKTVFECKDTSRHQLRWPDGTYPASIRHNAKRQFWEIVTTTRYEVRDMKQITELIEVKLIPTPPLKTRHAVSLAIMVCVKDAIEALEQIEATADGGSTVYFLEEARQARDHAKSWLTYLRTLIVASREQNRAVNKACTEIEIQFKAERSKKARASAKAPRKKTTKSVTPELVATRFNNRSQNTKWETVRDEIAEEFKVSERTVSRLYKIAKENNLVS